MKVTNCYDDPEVLRGWAEISQCENYRHSLQRTFRKGEGVCVFIMLNPSKADEKLNDPTVTKCSKFCKTWGYRSLIILNLFDLRATDPKELKVARDPFGPRRSSNIENLALGINTSLESVKFVFAWGNHGKLWDRDKEIIEQVMDHYDLTTPMCFKINKNGSPAHPLYQKDDAVLIEYPV